MNELSTDDFIAVYQGNWTQDAAVYFAIALEDIAPDYGAHVALTGGCLYKQGIRKDVDILFYRVRQVDEIDEPGLLAAITKIMGVTMRERFGWVQKATYKGKHVDFFFPESLHNDDNAPEEYRGTGR